MKVKLIVSAERYDEIAETLLKAGIGISEKSDLILSERNTSINYLIGKKGDVIYRIKTSDISHIESFSHEVIAYTYDGEYRIKNTF